jgi:hypothetical protein
MNAPPTETPIPATPLVATPTSQSTETALPSPTLHPTNTPTLTPPPPQIEPALSLEIPHGIAPTVNGRLSEGEWTGAEVVPLSNGGELHLIHADGYLFLGIRGDEESIGSVCHYSAGEISILHASAGYTTYKYNRTDEDWQLRAMIIGSYHMQLPESLWQEQHLIDYGWTSSLSNNGNRNEYEYQIALPEKDLILAVASVFGFGDSTFLDFETWPDNLNDDCGRMELSSVTPDLSRLHFTPETWAKLIFIDPD